MMYDEVGDELVRRIEALLPQYPHVLKITEVFDLFRISEFKCGDLEPSLAQAIFALRKVQERHKQI